MKSLLHKMLSICKTLLSQFWNPTDSIGSLTDGMSKPIFFTIFCKIHAIKKQKKANF